MKKIIPPTLSVVVPVFNEDKGIRSFHLSLINHLSALSLTYEVIYCDDGSSDDSYEVIKNMSKTQSEVKLIKLSRNFGKEYALTAGIAQAQGDAIIMLDADGQHPVSLIRQFVKRWQENNKIVIGIRKAPASRSVIHQWRSRLFYYLFNKISGEKLIPDSTDFRLIDKEVAQIFLSLTENNRITRGLIDWLGFERAFIEFEANNRSYGEATYSLRKLIQLGVNSFVSLSNVPLFLFGYLGTFITGASGIIGTVILVEQIILRDPLAWNFTGTAMLSILILFLIGIVLMSQGMLALYISHIHTQAKRRPLYIIDHSRSVRLNK